LNLPPVLGRDAKEISVETFRSMRETAFREDMDMESTAFREVSVRRDELLNFLKIVRRRKMWELVEPIENILDASVAESFAMDFLRTLARRKKLVMLEDIEALDLRDGE
jgi:hypothetical protein